VDRACDASADWPCVPRPVIGDKNCVWTDRFHNHGLQCYVAPTGSHGHPVCVFDAVLLRESGMNLYARIGILIAQVTENAQ
jgi:hypothetical protein